MIFSAPCWCLHICKNWHRWFTIMSKDWTIDCTCRRWWYMYLDCTFGNYPNSLWSYATYQSSWQTDWDPKRWITRSTWRLIWHEAITNLFFCTIVMIPAPTVNKSKMNWSYDCFCENQETINQTSSIKNKPIVWILFSLSLFF